MPGTLTISITKPDAKAMRTLGYRWMWTAALGGQALGWGHSSRRADAAVDAVEFVTEMVSPDQVEDIQIIA
jgi:hypothetical protein